jgi:hypothetical protein
MVCTSFLYYSLIEAQGRAIALLRALIHDPHGATRSVGRVHKARGFPPHSVEHIERDFLFIRRFLDSQIRTNNVKTFVCVCSKGNAARSGRRTRDGAEEALRPLVPRIREASTLSGSDRLSLSVFHWAHIAKYLRGKSAVKPEIDWNVPLVILSALRLHQFYKRQTFAGGC